MKVLLMCMGGFSTGVLTEKMRRVCKEKGQDAEIKAVGSAELDGVIGEYDCLLLAPQVGYMENEIRQKYPSFPIYLIQPADYGRVNAEKIVEEAIKLVR